MGDGVLRTQLEKYIEDNDLQDHVVMAGFQSQSEVPMLMQKNDILVLPSIYDGWGAVINEALQAGLYVVCSDACGAADLLNDDKLGKVFHSGDENELSDIMLWCYDNISVIRNNVNWRKQWADEHINGLVLAKYMVDCLCGESTNLLY